MLYIEPEILERVNNWLTPTFDQNTQDQIKDLLSSNPTELKESFYKNLEFGTGGMRGIMGVGTNRINKYTLGKNTQGLSNYLHQSFKNEPLKAVIGYDCRHNSKTLAKVVADVFSANGITVYLFEDLRATPEVSFALKYLHCHCGIVLTASHNPPEYNGYKVYWQDGGQLVPPQDEEIIQVIEEVAYPEIKFEADDSLIHFIGEDIDKAFIDGSIKNGTFDTSDKAREDLKIVFTSLHGTSVTTIPETLKRAGYTKVFQVEEQAEPDGDFPTVKSPNPEEPEALKLALKLADEVNADIVIGTDPDGDRLGIAVRNFKDEMELLNGNQTMLLMTSFLLQKWQKNDKIKGKEFIATTIVSTPMMIELGKYYNVECKMGLTGFKWIAKMIKDFPDLKFIGGGEESFGYMVGDFVRDKDANTSTLLACEIAAQAKANGSSFYEELIQLYVEHGFYKEKLISLTKKGISGAEEINQMMVDARNNPLTEIAGEKVVRIEDYELSIVKNIAKGTQETLDIPKSNVLIYYTENGTKIALRPSGTEPKIKFYMSVNTKLDTAQNFKIAETLLDNKIQTIVKEMKIG